MVLLIRILALLLILLGAVWLIQLGSEQPGYVMLQWQGYQVETTATFLVALANILVILAFLVGRLVGWVATLPQRWGNFKANRKLRKDMGYFEQAMYGLLAGDMRTAKDAAKKARRVGLEPRLNGLIEVAVEKDEHRLHALLDNPHTAFLGHYGLMQRALERQDWPEVARQSAKALRLRRHSPAMMEARLQALLHQGHWLEAQLLLPKLKRDDRISAEEHALQGTMISLQRANEQKARGEVDSALRLVAQARRRMPDFPPLALFEATTLMEQGKLGQAEKVLAHSWQQTPRLDTFRKWFELICTRPRSLKPEKQRKLAEQLTKTKWDDEHHGVIACLCFAEACRLTGDLKQAQSFFERSLSLQPNAEAYRRLADLALKQDADMDTVNSYLKQAGQQPELEQPGDDLFARYQHFKKTYVATATTLSSVATSALPGTDHNATKSKTGLPAVT